MRLRTRFADEIHSRLQAFLPDAMDTVWDIKSVVVAIEQIKFTSAGGLEGNWDRNATFTGVVRGELRSENIDALPVEPLIASLVAAPVFLEFDAGVPLGGLSEKARFILADWRDVIRDAQVASALRFNVEGTLAAHTNPDPMADTVVIAGEIS